MNKPPSPLPGLEQTLLRYQDRLRRIFPGGLGSARGLGLAAAAVLVLWGMSGFYRVQPDEQGIELLFGKYAGTTQPGLNYWFPAPIGEVIKPKVTRTNQITIGLREATGANAAAPRESLVLTGDQNIADIRFVVQWRVRDARAFLFNVRNPEATVKIAAESAVREIVGANVLTAIVTNQRDALAQDARELLQRIMDEFNAGITILDLRIQQADPPAEVIDAFNDVQRAKQDGERLANEALSYRNDIVPRARGDAARSVQNAAAQKVKLIREAEGEAARFAAIYETFTAHKDLTILRMYFETMEDVLRKANVIIIDRAGTGAGTGTGGVTPYLPLPEIHKRMRAGQSAP